MTKESFYRFRLYIVGSGSAGKRAVANFQKVAEIVYGYHVDLEVVDVQENPALLEEDRILAVPTLVRLSPAPVRRIVGDLTNEHTLQDFLGG